MPAGHSVDQDWGLSFLGKLKPTVPYRPGIIGVSALPEDKKRGKAI